MSDLSAHLDAQRHLAPAQTRVAEPAAVASIGTQLDLLRRRLLADPRAFRDFFISEGMAAVAAEFHRGELSAEFTRTLWDVLLRDDDASTVLMRFVWDVPLKLKRVFITALDHHLADRYPMFAGLSVNWPAGNSITPYVRPADARAADFGLVNQGFLGYLTQGYSPREVDLFVWLEAIRDKQCTEKPCEIGELIAGRSERRGGCPVQIHIPAMLELLGTGRFREALELIETANPLPNVTGRVCPQELQCQGVCAHQNRPIEIGQIEWFLPQREKLVEPGATARRFAGRPDPWRTATRPPVAVVGSGPSGLINAYLLAAEGFPVTVFEAFHALGGVLRYGIPEFRLPNELIDDVVTRIRLLGGRFVPNFVVGKTATLADLRAAGFWRTFVGTGAGLPRFMNVPGEHLLNVMSANEFLTRVNLMQGLREEYETPLPETRGKRVLVIGGGNTAMDAARTARRLGGLVTIVYRRTRAEMPARVEELHHALEEGIELLVLAAPREFLGDDVTHRVRHAVLDVMELGEPDASGRRSPTPTGRADTIEADLVIMALGNTSNPIIADSQPDLATTRWGTIDLVDAQRTSLTGVYSGGDATRGGSTAIRAAGDGQAAARQIVGDIDVTEDDIAAMVASAGTYTTLAAEPPRIVARTVLAEGIVEFVIRSPMIARAARAGQFVRVLAQPKGELIPLTLADWDAAAGTITLVVQGLGASSILINRMSVGDAFVGIAGPLGRPSELSPVEPVETPTPTPAEQPTTPTMAEEPAQRASRSLAPTPAEEPAQRASRSLAPTVVFTAGGVGLPPVYPIAREHLRLGNHVTLIAGFRSASLLFWTGADERVGRLQAEYGDQLEVIYTSNDGSFGAKGFVTGPLAELLEAHRQGVGRPIAEVVTIGPPLMMRAVCDLTRGYGVKTVASLNSIMVDATGMCGACMVPVTIDGRLVRRHACIDGPEIDGHVIDWDKFLPRFNQFKAQEQASRVRHGL